MNETVLDDGWSELVTPVRIRRKVANNLQNNTN
jgi:hypothetical protein